jgi:hypothetical protein
LNYLNYFVIQRPDFSVLFEYKPAVELTDCWWQ